MLPFWESFAVIFVAFVAPCFIGLLLISVVAKRANPRYLAAFSIGIYVWFFSDTAGDASYLYVNEGYSGGLPHASLLILFAAALILVFFLDPGVFSSGAVSRGVGFGIPLLVAFAMGFHGLGEGAAFSETAASTLGTNLLDVFGGFSAGLAFVLHKALEPMIAGAAYCIYARDRARGHWGLLRDVLLLTLVFSLPGIVGGATDYFLNYDTTYFFAFGLGTSLLGVVRLAKPLFWDDEVRREEVLKTSLLMLLGFVLIYLAALFHST
jgi:hypothetical protein